MVTEKKKSYEVEIPILGQSTYVLSSNVDLLPKKIIKMDLTRSLRGKNLEANIMIFKEEGKLVGKVVSLHLLPGYVRKMMRKGVSWIEDSFVCPGKESQIIFKPFMLTRKKVHRSVKRELRNLAKKVIVEFAKEKDNDQIFSAVISGQLQKEIQVILKKIYPLAFCEIKITKIK